MARILGMEPRDASLRTGQPAEHAVNDGVGYEQRQGCSPDTDVS
jgi:hypothetical protein